MHQAKSELSRLVRDVLAGKRVRIALRGQPVVELHPIKEDSTFRVPGLLKGKIRISGDFYDTSDEVNALFEGDLDNSTDSKPDQPS